MDQLSEYDWDRVISVNLRGVYLCCKHAIPHLAANGTGAIVNIASMFGLVGAHHLPAYCAAKGGVIGLTNSWRSTTAHKASASTRSAPASWTTIWTRAGT